MTGPQIMSAAQLDALPVRSVVLDRQGDPWVRHTASLGPWVSPETRSCHSERLVRKWGPLAVLYRPDEPQRVQPSREDVAATLAPIEALHSMKRTVYLRRDAQGDDHWDEVQFCRGCSADWPCPTAQAIADIKAKAGA